MAKRGYKLQEFVAHQANVNCLNIGKKACRLFITGGDDHKVNLWTIGKPTSLMNLCGHTSPVDSVAFDSAEVLVLAGASTGVIKMWDLEEAKMVRTLTGHRSNCTALEFHPFGEFFASGSMDTNLKIWDIRKKACIHTYKGHTQGVSTIRFTPDGRWVVSGGFDSAVKVWDLTAGKLLHDFKFHEGHIRSIDFHPLEFLLATGSADRTVKFWDLETFELIGSARPEATGVRAITFHPDGRTLFCGLDDSLKVYSWEPVVFHDTVDMGWSTLGDLCIHEGKLLACSHYQNSIGVWVADISLIEPYGASLVPSQGDLVEFDLQERCSSEKVGSGIRSTSGSRCMSPDYDTKEIKNIYVDSTDRNPVTSQRVGSLDSPKVVTPVDCKEISDLPTKQGPAIGVRAKSNGQALNKSSVVPSIVPRDSPDRKDSAANSRRESITFARTGPGMLLRPAHIRKPSNSKNDVERLSVTVESGIFRNTSIALDSAVDPDVQTRLTSDDQAGKSCEEGHSNMTGVTEKFEKVLSPQTPSVQESCDNSPNSSKGMGSVKFVNGVAVVRGRTRSLVERFERREGFSSNEDQATNMAARMVLETDKTQDMPIGKEIFYGTEDQATNMAARMVPETDETPAMPIGKKIFFGTEDQATNMAARMVPETDKTPAMPIGKEIFYATEEQATNMVLHVVPEMDKMPAMPVGRERSNRNGDQATNMTARVIPEMDKAPTLPIGKEIFNETEDQATNLVLRVIPEMDRMPPMPVGRERSNRNEDQATYMASRVIPETDKTLTIPKGEPQISGRDLTSASDGNVAEVLMQTHDVLLSTLRSRLTKLQVVRHFWERKDIKGAINALRKLPDHSVQADVISVLMEKMDILTLDFFSCLLPVLLSLLDSKTERHANVSLEMLLKLVAVFGPVVRSTISAPRAVGVDLHAEKRLECCNQCFIQLQKIQKILPVLVRRGGLLAKCARELNLVLQES